MLAATNFTKPLELQVTVPLTLRGFQYTEGSAWEGRSSEAHIDTKKFSSERFYGVSFSGKGIIVGSIQLNPTTNQIVAIALNHFSYQSEKKEDIENTKVEIDSVVSNYPKSHTYLFIIGSEDITPEGGVLSDVRSAIDKHFGNTDCIRQQKLDVCEGKNGNTLQAGAWADGKMLYSVFNRTRTLS